MSIMVNVPGPVSDEVWLSGIIFGYQDHILLDLYSVLTLIGDQRNSVESHAWVAVNIRMEHLTGNPKVLKMNLLQWAMKAALNGWDISLLEDLKNG